MKITLENTRALGVGETVLPDDLYVERCGDSLDYFYSVTKPEVGKIITEDETTEYRRLIGSNPYDAIEAELGLETEAGKQALRVALECVKLLDRKHADYGPGNIAAFGEFGLTVRLSDKIERLKNLVRMETPKNESLEDTYMDIANYGIIALMVRRNEWK